MARQVGRSASPAPRPPLTTVARLHDTRRAERPERRERLPVREVFLRVLQDLEYVEALLLGQPIPQPAVDFVLSGLRKRVKLLRVNQEAARIFEHPRLHVEFAQGAAFAVLGTERGEIGGVALRALN